MSSNVLKLKQLQFGFAGCSLGTPLDFALPQGKILGILGMNGSGKSSLVKTLLGLIPPYSGEYNWLIPKNFGYVPQETEIDEIFPFTVLDVLKMGKFPQLTRWRHRPSSVKKHAQMILEELDLQAQEKRLFRELSGGQKQRVLLGRALMGEPNVLVLDEPFNNLDYAYREKFWELLTKWQQEQQLTLIIIDHDLNRIINQIDYMVVLGPHQTLAGSASDLLKEEILAEALEAPLHLHDEDGCLQIHFL